MDSLHEGVQEFLHASQAWPMCNSLNIYADAVSDFIKIGFYILKLFHAFGHTDRWINFNRFFAVLEMCLNRNRRS